MFTTDICFGLSSLIIGLAGAEMKVGSDPGDQLGGGRTNEVNSIEENETSAEKDS